jgi:hypothetical protein
MLSLINLGTDHAQERDPVLLKHLCWVSYLISVQPVHWRADCCLSTCCKFLPLRTQLPLLLVGTCLRSRYLAMRHNTVTCLLKARNQKQAETTGTKERLHKHVLCLAIAQRQSCDGVRGHARSNGRAVGSGVLWASLADPVRAEESKAHSQLRVAESGGSARTQKKENVTRWKPLPSSTVKTAAESTVVCDNDL